MLGFKKIPAAIPTTEPAPFKPSHPYQLKIKAKSLAAEAKIIRTEERKRLSRLKQIADEEKASRIRSEFHGLQAHRRINVRQEARATNIARGFLSGKTYVHIENKRRWEPNWERALSMILKYGPACTSNEQAIMKGQFEAWKNAGNETMVKLK